MNDKLYRDIGKRIKLARRACSITQERLAEMVGVTVSAAPTCPEKAELN